MSGGLALAALGYLIATQVARAEGAWLLALGMMLQSIGMAPLFTLTNDLILAAAPPERAGAASGISETVSELGGALGIALLGTLATAVYGAALAPSTVLQALELTAALSAAIVAGMIVVVLKWLRPATVAAA
jgi:DHA2 family multidrug resistance protein-like MFS transporter